jgi:amino acid adenylation domain-containing protein
VNDRAASGADLSAARRALLAKLLDAEGITAVEREAITPRPADATVPLSFGQQRLWFLDRLAPGRGAYNVDSQLRLPEPVDTEALAGAIKTLVHRHEALRTTIAIENGQPVQHVNRAAMATLRMLDLRALNHRDRQTEARRLATAEVQLPIDLEHGPLLRATLLRLDDHERVLLLTVHHIACDGWSMFILNRELTVLYRAFAAGQPSPLPALPIQYGDYAIWQRNRVSGDLLERELAYWRHQLTGLSPINLPTDYARPPESSGRGGQVLFSVDADLTARLRALSQQAEVTLFMTLLAALQILLVRYSGQTDITIGAPVAGRGRAELEPLIGFFVNTLALRIDLSGNPTVAEALARVRRVALDAFAHQETPFERLVEDLAPQRDLGRNPLVEVAFQLFQQQSPGGVPDQGELGPPALEVDRSTAKFDLTLTLTPTQQGLLGGWEYSSDLFERTTIERMVGHYHTLLDGMAANPMTRLWNLTLLTEQERRKIVERNRSTSAPPEWNGVHELVAAQARRSPGATAVISGDQRLTYAELDARATALAHRLRRLGVGPDVLVGLLVERSPALAVGALAVLKAGGAYLPLDPAAPPDRLAWMLADSGTPILLSQGKLARRLPPHLAQVLEFDAEWHDAGAHAEDPLLSHTEPEHLAYAIYTSGSTGRPKAVAVPHRGLANLVAWHRDAFAIRAEDRTTQLAGLGFDAAVWELWPTLASGATLLLPDETTRADPVRLLHWLADQRITVTFLPTPLAEAVLAHPMPMDLVLRLLLTGGDRLHGQPSQQLPFALVNNYGPTECSVVATSAVVPADAGTPPIGLPIANIHAYVLDRAGLLVPDGVPGELYLGGAGLARGYIGRPDLTAEKFVPNAFADVPGARLYRTGDLVRWQPDGQLEFLGRLDQQVKLRGYRIELAEIEAAIIRHPAVKEAAVVLRQDRPGDGRLAAYVTSVTSRPPSLEELRRFLAVSLPEYMLPATLSVMDALPLTANGKLDRTALPLQVIPTDDDGNQSLVVAPTGQLEEAVAGIWQEVLGLERAGVRSNFFDLGGHSLALMQVQEKLKTALGRDVPILDLFRHPTIADLARHLAGEEDTRPEPLLPRSPAPRSTGNDIAIIGMAGRFPGAPDLETYWANLRAGVESIRIFRDEEVAAEGIPPDLRQNPAYVRSGGALDGADHFDAAFFGLNPREADTMDPQQRLFLEAAWAALEDAGYPPTQAPGAVGVFAGSGANDYRYRVLADANLVATVGAYQVALGSNQDHLATRVAYTLDLRGPAVTVQTACSTSLVAVVMACQSLLAGQCDVALAGGVAVAIPQAAGYLYQEGGILSPDGHCRVFDAAAAGTVPGSGVGAVALKRRDDAVADGDVIHALIRGSAINNDGANKVGYTAPSEQGQAAVIAAAQAQAGIAPETIGYVEAHGTGTPLGDPIEVAALRRVFAGVGRATCALGSVKSNLGHLDAAAGVAGLIKAVLALKHEEIPPSLHFSTPNPKLELDSSPFFVPTRAVPWPAGVAPRRAGVSSFGIGGTNAHVVLEEAPAIPASSAGRPAQVLLLSAKAPAAVERAALALADHLERAPGINLADVAYTLQIGREQFSHRRAVVSRNRGEALEALRASGRTALVASRATPVLFLFPGQGAQHVGMARGLYQSEPVFRESLDYCAELLAPALGQDLRRVLYAEEAAAAALDQTELAQPALFAIEYALAQMWIARGVRPAAMLGHSLGEYVAACIAGVFSLEDALGLVAARGRLMQRTSAGAMLAVSLSEQAIQPQLCGNLALAAVNGPTACVVAGPRAELAKLASRLETQRVATAWLPTAHAFHSPLVEPMLADLKAEVTRVRRQPPRVPYLSNLTGGWISASDATDPDYWVRHARQPVRFAEGLREAVRDSRHFLLEVGPGQTLSRLARAAAPTVAGFGSVSTLPRPNGKETDEMALARAQAELWLAGVELNWAALHHPERRLRVSLPTYPFERERHWIDTPAPPSIGLTKDRDPEHWFYLPTWIRALPAAWRDGAIRSTEQNPWLIFGDRCGLAERMATRLRRSGRRVTVVADGDHFEQTDDEIFAINPGRPEDYLALLGALRAAGSLPHAIVHLWAVTPEEASPGSVALEAMLDRTFYSLLFLAQALDRQAPGHPAHLTVVTSGVQAVSGDEALSPLKATTLGPFRVIAKEQTNLTCSHVDLVMPTSARAWEQLSDDLVAECLAPEVTAPVAWRHGQRWVQRFERATPPEAGPPPLREGGVYLITGGLGGIGLALAEFLARSVRAKLVLVGRNGLPDRVAWEWQLATVGDTAVSERLRRVLALEALGAQVIIAQADVADEAALARIVRETVTRFGALHGVIHAAGVPGEGIIQRKTRAAAARVLAPKVQGTLALTAALGEQQLDFLLLCSSLSVVAGGAGDVDYVAANAFLDAYAQWAAAVKAGSVISVNWDTWQEVGMAARTDLPVEYRTALAAYIGEGLLPAEGVDVFHRLLAAPVPQIAISTRDLPARLARQAKVERADSAPAAPDSRHGHARPDLLEAYAAPESPVEQTIAGLWQALLGIERIGRHDNFFDLGGHSLLAIQVVSQLRVTLHVVVSLQAVFDAPTIAELAAVIEATEQDGSKEAGELAHLLDLVEHLPAEQVKVLLSQEANPK